MERSTLTVRAAVIMTNQTMMIAAAAAALTHRSAGCHPTPYSVALVSSQVTT